MRLENRTAHIKSLDTSSKATLASRYIELISESSIGFPFHSMFRVIRFFFSL